MESKAVCSLDEYLKAKSIDAFFDTLAYRKDHPRSRLMIVRFKRVDLSFKE